MNCLNIINQMMTAAGLNYEFGRMTNITYPYFVGEIQETATDTENGMQEAVFYLDGFTIEQWDELFKAKDKIKELFTDCITISDDGTGVWIDYSGMIQVPIDTADYKHIQITLNIKEWSVNV